MIPPRGCLVKPSRGKSPLVPSSSGGMDSPQKGEIRSHLDFVSPPVFPISAPWSGVSKKCYGMPNVLPPVVSVKRIHLHIVARKCHTYPIWKNPAASSGCPEQPGSSRSRRERAGARERFAERVRPATRLARGPVRAMCRWGMLAMAHRCSRTERADECSGTLPRTRQHNRRGGRNVRGRGRR
jgi:hypothetical protein